MALGLTEEAQEAQGLIPYFLGQKFEYRTSDKR